MAEALNGQIRIAHTIDDVDANVVTTKTLFCVASDSVSGNINVVLWGEAINSPVVMDAQKADQKNINIKKIYDTDTTIAQGDFFLLK